MTSPTFGQIRAQVAAIRKKIPNARTVAVRAKGRWTGETQRVEDGETFLIHQCDSPLAMRIALRNGGDNVTTVLITDVDDREISDDIRVRLKPRRVVPLDNWQIVKTLFQARTIDPRVARHEWIADVLMELIPPAGFPPVASGFLDAEKVWPVLLAGIIGFDAETVDTQSLLKWSTHPDHVAKFRTASSAFREAAIEWLVSLAGTTASAVLRCVADNDRPDALPIGLAAAVVFHPEAAGKLERAAGKLEERYLTGQTLDAQTLHRWSAAATDVVRLQLTDLRLKQQLLQRADEILREVGAETFAQLSDTSPIGFHQRLAGFGMRLSEVLSSSTIRSLDALVTARQAILQHDRHAMERRRLQRVEMAMRLLRWLRERDETQGPRSLAQAATGHLTEGAFVDWARLTLRIGDPVRELSEAYAKVFDRATAVREQQACAFAELLRDWTASKTTDDAVVPVEEILERIVAPLAAHAPILLIVIDGMSAAVFRELLTDVINQDWTLLVEDEHGQRAALATIPSVTEISRTSLFCGRLGQGNANTEKAGFAEHPGLLVCCRSNLPPVLFHKAALQEAVDTSLAADVRKEIASQHRRIVGVVVNAVDDHLLKGEQIDTRWTRDEIKVLPTLLHEARMAGRIVVMTGDHGHIVDCNARAEVYEGGERWRPDTGQAAEGELRIGGPRVVVPESKQLIAPWTEKIRYGVKKNGYHGGLNPQEMVIPLAVLNATNAIPQGWVEAPLDLPSWWDPFAPETELRERPTPKLKTPMPKEKPRGVLFDLDAQDTEPAEVVTGAKPVAEWITALLTSPIFEAQKELGGRAVPANELLGQLLSAIDGRGGKITAPALARAIQFSPMRLRGLLAVAQRILNVDGYAVLTRDEVSDTIELDRNLLCRQFDLVARET